MPLRNSRETDILRRTRSGFASSLVLLTLVLLCRPVAAQHGVSLRPPDQTIGGVPLVLAEHGSEEAAFPPAIGLLGLIVFDIATASQSANRHNLLNPDDPVSPRAATQQSLLWTVVPLGLAVGLGNTTDSAIGPAVLMGGAALIVGPSMGHFYSSRYKRGLVSAGLRAGLGIVTFGLALAAS